MTRDNMYRPKHNWTLLVQAHLNKSLSEEGLIRQSVVSKSASFISHPLPECSCRISSAEAPVHNVKGDNGQFLYGGEDECPKWFGQEVVLTESGGDEEGKSEDSEIPEYGSDQVEEAESNENDNTKLAFDQDDEMDPDD